MAKGSMFNLSNTPNSQRSSSTPPPWSPSHPEEYDEQFYRTILGLTGECRGDCPQNRIDDPFCLCRLEQCERESYDHPMLKLRKGIPAGLMNLGQLCYMNSYLQTLFNILPVRHTLYEWRKPPPAERDPKKDYGAAEELQRVFARLQSTEDASVSPGGLVKAMRVKVTRQQDAQEFSVILLEHVDQVIAQQPKEEKIRSLFAGKSRSVIKCRACQAESATEGEFSDLCLQTNDVEDLKGALELFYAKEELDEYSCEKCSTRGKANKTLHLLNLPRFLNVHLSRYCYDTEAMKRKKLMHAVTFPTVLDMRPYLNAEQVAEWGEQGCCYELMAILIHQGSAQYGHYFARIRNAQDGKWYTYDDESVTPFSPMEGDTNDAKGAYMLVYEKRKDVEPEPQIPAVPSHVNVREHRSTSSWRTSHLKQAWGSIAMEKFLANLRVKSRVPVLWLPTVWLVNVAQAVADGEIDSVILQPNLTRHVCTHSRLGNVRGLKAVDRMQAEKLLYGLEVDPKPFYMDGSLYCAKCTRAGDESSPL